MRCITYLVLLSALIGCAGAKKQAISPRVLDPEAKVSPLAALPGQELLFDGPRATLSSFCAEADDSCAKAATGPLSGEILSYALLDNDGVFNSPRLALQTSAGWFVEHAKTSNLPSSHHEPSSLWFDPAKIDIKDGVFSIPLVFSQSVFVPGKGSEGASHYTSTKKYHCVVWEGEVQCKG